MNYLKNLLIIILFSCLPLIAFASETSYCGDGSLNELHEECDDGNFINRDGCSTYCKIED